MHYSLEYLEKENRRLQRLLSEQDFFNKFLRVKIKEAQVSSKGLQPHNYFRMSVGDILANAPADLSDEITDV